MTREKLEELLQIFSYDPSPELFDEIKRVAYEENDYPTLEFTDCLEETVRRIKEGLNVLMKHPQLKLVDEIDDSYSFLSFIKNNEYLRECFNRLPEWIDEKHLMSAGPGAAEAIEDAIRLYHDIKSRRDWVQEEIADYIATSYDDPRKIKELAKKYKVDEDILISMIEKRKDYPRAYVAAIIGSTALYVLTNSAAVISLIHKLMNGQDVSNEIHSLIAAHKTLQTAYEEFENVYNFLGRPPVNLLVGLIPALKELAEYTEAVDFVVRHGKDLVDSMSKFVKSHIDFNYFMLSKSEEIVRIANPMAVLNGEVDSETEEEFKKNLVELAEKVDEHIEQLENFGPLAKDEIEEIHNTLLEVFGIKYKYSYFADFVYDVTGYRMRADV